jgi:MarC family integral membrane protein
MMTLDIGTCFDRIEHTFIMQSIWRFKSSMTPAILNYAIGTLAALFPIANPIGSVPIFYSLTVADTRSDRRKQAQRTSINVILILAVFLIGGRTILGFFGISLDVLRIAGDCWFPMLLGKWSRADRA